MQMDKYKEKISNVIKSDICKEIVVVFLYLLICYIYMVFLSGDRINLKTFVIFSEFWGENVKNVVTYIFSFQKFIYNFLIFIFFYIFISGITNRKISCTIVSVFTLGFGVLNYIVKQIRGAAITVSDIFSIRTALNVAKGIKIDIDLILIVSIILFIIINLILWIFIKFRNKQKTRARIIKIFIGIIGIIVLCIKIDKINLLSEETEIFNINSEYNKLGANVTLMKMIKDLNVSKPKNYNKNKIEGILEQYTDDIREKNENLPNVIVVINESFADLQSVYNFEDISEDNIKYFHELIGEENVVSGIMHSSWYGYGTANVEYEFLTQNTTAFLPKGSVPYQQYITKEVKESMVEYMNKLNYNTYGIHPYYETGYNRFKIYNLLKFKNVVFLYDMPNITGSLNMFPSDASTYSYWYNIMNEKENTEKNFTFIMTVQNHVPYNNIDRNRVKYSEDKQLNSYMQGEEESDEALKELIEFIKNYNENTILLFFGDHQPSLNILNNGDIDSNYSKEEEKYIIPFIIFANFDIEEQSNIEISTNYLQSLLLDVANMPKTSYAKYVSKLREEIPVITAQYYKDKDGNLYNVQDKESPYYNKIQEYWQIIYYKMFID